MSDPIERVKEIAAELIGCCSGSRLELEQEMNELGVASKKEPSEAFDEVAFCCDGCGWYCSVDEKHDETGNLLCDDCAEDEGSEFQENG